MERKIIKINESENLDGNRFVKFAISAYDIGQFGGMGIVRELNSKTKIHIDKKFPFIHFVKEKQYVTKLDEFNNDIDSYIKNIIYENPEVSFRLLMKYCQFLRWVEKSCFYHNDITKSIICDSSMYSNSEDDFEGKLIFQSSDITITLSMKKVRIIKASIFDLDTGDSPFSNIIEIDIKRNYGKMLANKFIVVDGNTKINDSSDQYLLRTVNRIVQDNIALQFKSIINDIVNNTYLEDFKFRE